MTIIPYFCTNNTTICVSPGSKVTIYNKIGDAFTLLVGSGLTLDSIVIDSLDSIVGYNPAESCLSYGTQCCKIDTD